MRSYTLKRKGKTIWQNMMIDREMHFAGGTKVYAGYIFFRKKDATKYLNSFVDKRFYEVIGMTVDNSKEDNRRRKNERSNH